MTTTVTPNLKPDHAESDRRPTLVPVPADTTPQERDVHTFDPTQGRKLGADPYDDPRRDASSVPTRTTTPPRDASRL
jgi:hypothetical protein